MRVLLVSAGSRGDLEPYLALARAFLDAGHQVRFASTQDAAETVRERGLDFFPFRHRLGQLMELPGGDEANAPGLGLGRRLRAMRQLFRHARSFFRDVCQDTARACQGMDGVLGSTFGFALPHAAQALDLPFAWALIQPLHRTGRWPTFLAPRRSLGAVGNRFSHLAAERLAWGFLGSVVNRWRSEDLGLAKLTRRQHRQLFASKACLYGFSETLLPRPGDWSRQLQITGYWHSPPSDWQLTKPVVDFLDKGEPPLFVAYGSISARDPLRLRRQLLEALDRTGKRAILSRRPWSDEPPCEHPQVLEVDWVSYPALLPRVRGVIHHGGAGTTAAVLRAGQPAMVIPSLVDQHFWGFRLAERGAGLMPISARRLRVEDLVQAIRSLAEDQHLAAVARRAGHALQEEDGVAQAVRYFADLVQRSTDRGEDFAQLEATA